MPEEKYNFEGLDGSTNTSESSNDLSYNFDGIDDAVKKKDVEESTESSTESTTTSEVSDSEVQSTEIDSAIAEDRAADQEVVDAETPWYTSASKWIKDAAVEFDVSVNNAANQIYGGAGEIIGSESMVETANENLKSNQEFLSERRKTEIDEGSRTNIQDFENELKNEEREAKINNLIMANPEQIPSVIEDLDAQLLEMNMDMSSGSTDKRKELQDKKKRYAKIQDDIDFANFDGTIEDYILQFPESNRAELYNNKKSESFWLENAINEIKTADAPGRVIQLFKEKFGLDDSKETTVKSNRRFDALLDKIKEEEKSTGVDYGSSEFSIEDTSSIDEATKKGNIVNVEDDEEIVGLQNEKDRADKSAETMIADLNVEKYELKSKLSNAKMHSLVDENGNPYQITGAQIVEKASEAHRDYETHYNSLGDIDAELEKISKNNALISTAYKNINAAVSVYAEEITPEMQEKVNSGEITVEEANLLLDEKLNARYSELLSEDKSIQGEKEARMQAKKFNQNIDKLEKLRLEYNKYSESPVMKERRDIEKNLYGAYVSKNDVEKKYAMVDKVKGWEDEQKEIDLRARQDRFGFMFSITEGFARMGGGAIEGIAGLIEMGAAGGDYGIVERYAGKTRDWAHSKYMEKSSKYNRSLYEDKAVLGNGNEVVVNGDGEATTAYDKDGHQIMGEQGRRIVSDFNRQALDGNAPEVKYGSYNGDVMWNKFTSTTADMLALIRGGGLFTNAGRAAGLGVKASQYAGLTAAGIVMQADDLYHEALEGGMSKENSAIFGFAASSILGALENISPNQALMSGTLKRGVIKNALAFFKGKDITAKQARKYLYNQLKKEIPEEIVQEISQTLAEKKVVKNFANYAMDSQVFDTEVSMNEIKETLVLTAASTGGLHVGGSHKLFGVNKKSGDKKRNSFLREQALFEIMENTGVPESIDKINDLVKRGEWTEQQADYAKSTLNAAQVAWDNIPEDGNLSDRQRAATVNLLSSKYLLEQSKSNEPILNEIIDSQIENIDEQMKEVMSGEYFESKEGSHTVGNKVHQFVVASKEDGGLGTTTENITALQKKIEEEGLDSITAEEKELVTKYQNKVSEVTKAEDKRFESAAKKRLTEKGIKEPTTEQIFKEKQAVIKSENKEVESVVALYKKQEERNAEDKRTKEELATAKIEGKEGVTGSTTISEENLDEVDNLSAKAVTTSQKSALAQVKNVIKALGKYVPGVGVQIHGSTKDFLGATQDVEGVEGTESGMWIAEDGTIHINMETVRENTVAHEGVHPILEAIKETNPEMHAKLEKGLMSHIKDTPELAPYLAFGESYGKESVNDEAITEFLADVISGKTKLPAPVERTIVEKIKTYIKQKAPFLSLTDKELNAMENEQVFKLAQSIVGSVKTGKAFDAKAPEKTIEKVEGKKKGKRQNIKNPDTAKISEKYIADNPSLKLTSVDVNTDIKLDTDNSMKIADAYEAMKHQPNNKEVKAAFTALATETIEQYKSILDAGYSIELFEGDGESYPTSQAMIEDVKDNKKLVVYSTKQGYGSKEITNKERAENPLLRDSGHKDVNGETLLVNDIFRFVHDFFGHTEHGNGFGAKGEEIAWMNHSKMYSPDARKALTTETRGQNSWVNFGPQMRKEDGSMYKKGEEGYLDATKREFAPQKIGLLPSEFIEITETKKPSAKNLKRGKKQMAVSDFKVPDNIELIKDNNGNLLAPNGKKSNLSENNWKIVRSPEFISWFGDWTSLDIKSESLLEGIGKFSETIKKESSHSSIMLDKNGEPQLFYHGSPTQDITTFDKSKSEKNSGLMEHGLYFTTSEGLAEIYANKKELTQEAQDKVLKEIDNLNKKRDKVRNNKEYLELSDKIERLESMKGEVYPVFLNIRSAHEFNAQGNTWGEDAYYNLGLNVGYKNARGNEAIEFSKDGFERFGKTVVSPVEAVIANNIIDVARGRLSLSKDEISNWEGTSVVVFDGSNIKKAKFQKKSSKTYIEEYLENKFSEGKYTKKEFIKDAGKGELKTKHAFTKRQLEKLWTDARLYSKTNKIMEKLEKREIAALDKLKSLEMKEFYDVKQSELKTKIKELQDKIKNIKSSTAADKKQIKEDIKVIREMFKEYIEESGLENFKLPARLLKMANKVDNINNLLKFTVAAETYMDKQVRTDLKRVVSKSIKNINKRLAKGEYTNMKDVVFELTNIPFNSIHDERLLLDVVSMMDLVNRPNVAIVNKNAIQELINRVESYKEEQSELSDSITDEQIKETENLSKDEKIKALEDLIVAQHNKVQDLILTMSENNLESDNLGIDKELVNTRKQIRRLQRLLNNYHKASDGNMGNVQSLLNTFTSTVEVYNDIVEGYNKNRYNSAKEILKSVTDGDLSMYNKHELNAIQELSNTPFINDLQVMDNLLSVAYDLSYGYIPLSAINDISNASVVAKHSQDIFNAIDEAVEKRMETKGVDITESNVQKLVKKFSSKNLGYLSYLMGVKDNIIEKHITPLILRAETAMKKDMDSALDRFENAVKKLPGGDGILGRNKRKKALIKLGIIAHQNQENLNSEAPRDIWGDIMNNKAVLKEYGDDKDIYIEVYESLPKDENGVIDVEASMNELSKKESNVIDAFRETMDNDLSDKQKFINESNGIGYSKFDGYVPILTKGTSQKDVSTNDVVEESRKQLEAMFDGNTKIKSDRGKLRNDRSTKAIDANLGRLFNNSVLEVNRDFHFTPAIQRLNSMLNGAMNSSGRHWATDSNIKALKQRLKEGTSQLFYMTFTSSLGKISQRMLGFVYAYKLARPYKMPIDFVVDAHKMIVAGYNKNTAEVLVRGAVERLKVNLNRISSKLFPYGDTTTFEKLAKLSNSPFIMHFNTHSIQGDYDIGSGKMGMADWMMGFGDRNTVHMIWMPTMMAEFEKITGEKFSYEKFNNNPEYASNHSQAIKDASAVADNKTMMFKDSPVKSGKRTEILSIAGRVKSTSKVAPYLTYMTNYGFQEAMQTGMALNKIWRGKSHDSTREERNKSRREGLKELWATTFSGIAYGHLIAAEYALSKAAWTALEAFLKSGDDEEEAWEKYDQHMAEAKEKSNPKNWMKHSIHHAAFLASSKYGQSTRVLLMLIAGQAIESKALSKEQSAEIKEVSRELFYSDPIMFSRFGNIKTFTQIIPPLDLWMSLTLDMKESVRNATNLTYENLHRPDIDQGEYRDEVKWMELGFDLGSWTLMTFTNYRLPLMKDLNRGSNHLESEFNRSSSKSKYIHGSDVDSPEYFWNVNKESTKEWSKPKVKTHQNKKIKRKNFR